MKETRGLIMFDQLVAQLAQHEGALGNGYFPIAGVVPEAEAAVYAKILHERQAPALIICRDNDHARRMRSALQLFAPSEADRIVRLPDDELLPYDQDDPPTLLRLSRVWRLLDISKTDDSILVVSVHSLLQRLPRPEYWRRNRFTFSVSQKIDGALIRDVFTELGYTHTTENVELPGQYAVRAQHLDVFAFGERAPTRVGIEESTITRISPFNVETQRTLDEEYDFIYCLPRYDFIFNEKTRKNFVSAYWNHFEPGRDDLFFRDIKNGKTPPGLDHYMPLMEKAATIFDYFYYPPDIFIHASTSKKINAYWEAILERYNDASQDGFRNVLEPTECWMTSDNVTLAMGEGFYVYLSETPMEGALQAHTNHPRITPQHDFQQTVEMVREATEEASRVVFVLNSEHRVDQVKAIARFCRMSAKVVADFFKTEAPGAYIVMGSTEGSFADDDTGLVVISEQDIFGRIMHHSRPEQHHRRHDLESIDDISVLNINDPIVHSFHGIGRFQGMKDFTHKEMKKGFIGIEYSDQGLKYVPIEEIDIIFRYTGADQEKAPLHRFNDKRWKESLVQAQNNALETAKRIVAEKKRRQQNRKLPLEKPGAPYKRFCQEFPFSETDDQITAIDDILADQGSDQIMDRVVCGDVGFGKTEVAMRAAFVAWHNGFQVAIMAPTSLLARQHAASFRERFASFDVAIESTTEAKSPAQKRAASERIRNAEVDIIIGTNRLLSEDIFFVNLGLVIVDEEHRFGVQDKEAIADFRDSVDMISLSATPIPRTLGMALGGLRDFSIIATPPAKRLMICTIMQRESDRVIREAIQRESLRNGQVFYLHNTARTIFDKAEHIRSIAPDLRVEAVHAQMAEADIESIMASFYHGEIDVLVTTTIIETGIDVPNANTILIEDADRFGIAQLHQLRGRVGRSHRQGYAYLMTKGEARGSARQRLEALTEANQLGQGFVLAYQDMEIRGAGEILGSEQSGNIQKVGYSLYTRMLKNAIAYISGQMTSQDFFDLARHPVADLFLSTYIPSNYIPSLSTRISYYKETVSAETSEEVDFIAEEFEDRFGALPRPVKNLLLSCHIKCMFAGIGVKSVRCGPEIGAIHFEEGIDMDSVIEQMEETGHPIHADEKGNNAVIFSHGGTDPDVRINIVVDLLSALQAY